MDKYVIRSPKKVPQPGKKSEKKFYKQTKIENLKGVVIIEDIEKAKLILERQDSSSVLKVQTLEKLQEKLPSKEILIKTGIGKTVHSLCKNDDPDVVLSAEKVYKIWRNHIVSKVDRPMIEVKCDLKTQKLRESARTLIFKALNDPDSVDKDKKNSVQSNENNIVILDSDSSLAFDSENLKSLSELIEREVFSITKHKVNSVYKRTNRKIVFTLRYKPEVRLELVKSKISAQELVKKYLQMS